MPVTQNASCGSVDINTKKKQKEKSSKLLCGLKSHDAGTMLQGELHRSEQPSSVSLFPPVRGASFL